MDKKNESYQIQTVWKTKIHSKTKGIFPNQKILRIDDTIVSCGQSESVVRFIDCITGLMTQKHRDIEILSSYSNDSINCAIINDGNLFCAYSSGRILKVPMDGNGDILQNNSSNIVGMISDMIIYNKQLLTCGSWKCGLKLWDLNLRLNKEFLDSESRLFSIVYLSNHLLAGVPPNLSKEIIIYDLESAKVVNKLIGHLDMITTISCMPGGKIIASGSRDKTIRIWDAVTGECQYTFDTGAYVQEVKYSQDGKILLVSLAQPPIIQLYNSADYSYTSSPYSSHVDNSKSLLFYSTIISEDNQLIFSIDSDGFLHKFSSSISTQNGKIQY